MTKSDLEFIEEECLEAFVGYPSCDECPYEEECLEPCADFVESGGAGPDACNGSCGEDCCGGVGGTACCGGEDVSS